ncbi:hypothetical protein PAXRUDRAFT_10700 [Paxillus rubicundulus Ve08.2h10]|uniref:Uncharacterized protein n=1 Tax=Paxillus rubicundulus Ve08.2h10 TaxID=930991 RepID=A0A0D0E5G5_9AGAM|nr:hypothetical protein PAXRUDRAFT_10700 [Paxillus rubicundulus Ve08.2h10]
MVVAKIPRVLASACGPRLCLAQSDVRRQAIDISPLFLKEALIPWDINSSDYLIISERGLFKVLGFFHYGLQWFFEDREPTLSAAGEFVKWIPMHFHTVLPSLSFSYTAGFDWLKPTIQILRDFCNAPYQDATITIFGALVPHMLERRGDTRSLPLRS